MDLAVAGGLFLGCVVDLERNQAGRLVVGRVVVWGVRVLANCVARAMAFDNSLVERLLMGFLVALNMSVVTGLGVAWAVWRGVGCLPVCCAGGRRAGAGAVSALSFSNSSPGDRVSSTVGVQGGCVDKG